MNNKNRPQSPVHSYMHSSIRSSLLIVTMVVNSFSSMAIAQQEGALARSLPLVFDPQTKKYFIGGNSKFLIKEGDQSSIIERIEISVDGGDYRPYGESIKFGSEGKHALKFRAVNPVNNWSPVQFVEVFVDLTAPTSEAKFTEEKFHKASDDKVFVAQNSTISLASQDNLSGIASIEYSWDGDTYSVYNRPIAVEQMGSQTLYYRGVDRVGNVEAPRKLDLIADRTAPTSKLELIGSNRPAVINGRTYVSDSVAFKIEATDDSSKIKQTLVVLDGKATPYMKPVYFLEEGPHTLGYYSVDNVGNKEELKSIAIFTVSTPPSTMAKAIGKSVNTGGINYALPGFKLEFAAKDNIVGVDRVEYRIDSEQEFQPYIEPLIFKKPGTHTVHYRAVDRAGNNEPTKSYTVHVQESAPETLITTAQPLVARDGIVYSPAPNVINFNVGNSSVGVQQTLVSLNDGPFTPYSNPITLTTEHKVYKIRYKSVDKLGNEEAPKTVTYNMIGAIPIIDLFVSNGKSNEEQVRTHYLEQPAQPAQPVESQESDRKPASETAPVSNETQQESVAHTTD